MQAAPSASASAVPTPTSTDLPFNQFLTPAYLIGLYKGRTDIQGDTLAKRYIEKFDIGMNGRIGAVYSNGEDDGVTVMLELRAGLRGFAEFSETSPDLPTIKSLKLGDRISVMGPLEEVNREFVSLRDCRVVSIGADSK